MVLAKCCSVLFIVLYIMGSASALSAEYDVEISENGNSLVIINVSGKDCFDLPLPLDVAEPNVTGALYVYSEKGAEICIGSTESAIIVYKSSLLTEKAENWAFKMELPSFEEASAKIHFPANAIVTETNPPAKMGQINGSKYAIYNINNETASIEAKYKFGTAETPAAATTGFYALVQNYGIYGILLLVAIAAVLSYFFYFNKKLAKITPGQENVVKTLTDNEAKVVKMLLENKGDVKRNILERSSMLAKSSLAAVLYNLENKNIVGVDKSNTVHHVKLSDWFKGL